MEQWYDMEMTEDGKRYSAKLFEDQYDRRLIRFPVKKGRHLRKIPSPDKHKAREAQSAGTSSCQEQYSSCTTS